MFYFGVDYYPEHWPEERWARDAALMAEAGMNVVRLAEFAWSRMEPAEGRFEFDWLDRAIEVVAGEGIEVVLGTPTASPPPWLMAKHPDAFLTRADGIRVTYGNRRNYSPNNDAYREHSRQITTRMAERYREHRAVTGWQIDNEFGDRDYDAPAFRNWLKERYGSLEVINERWGTVFWSHVYTDWEQIPVPLTTGGQPNPGLALDFYRFCSDSYVSFQKEQVEILRWLCPGHFITHNLMGFKYDLIDYFDLARDLDFVSWDNYPRGFWNIESKVDPTRMALGHDTMRGLKGRNFWVMEQQAGPGGWDVIGVSPRPGELRLWAYQAIAHGADALVFFRWRTARHGTEQYWHGLLEHDGRPSRRYREIAGMGAELREVGERVIGSAPRGEVAMILSYDSRFALQIQPNNPAFDYSEQFLTIYRALARMNVAVDIVSPEDDLAAYKAVIAPSLYVLGEEAAASLEGFVWQGGVLLVTTRSGVRDEANVIVERPLPALLAGLCGVVVEEYDSLPEGESIPIVFESEGRAVGEAAGAKGRGGVWCDVLEPDGADVLARYGGNLHYSGRAAITVASHGAGQAIYLGTVGDEMLNDKLMTLLVERAGVRTEPDLAPGVELARRYGDDSVLLFVLNHGDESAVVELDGSYQGLVGPDADGGRLVLEPKGVALLQRNATPGAERGEQGEGSGA